MPIPMPQGRMDTLEVLSWVWRKAGGRGSVGVAIMAEFFAEGKPRGRDEKSTGRRGSTRVYTTDQGRRWRDAVRAQAMANRPELPFSGPIWLRLVFSEQRPKNHFRRDGVTLSAEGKRMPFPITKPDWDNLGKPVCDAISGLYYDDDKQIIYGEIKEEYCWPEQPEGVYVRVWGLPGCDES